MSFDIGLLSSLAAHCELSDRRRLLSVYPQCFTAPDALTVAMKYLRCTQSEAITEINKLIRAGKIKTAYSAGNININEKQRNSVSRNTSSSSSSNNNNNNNVSSFPDGELNINSFSVGSPLYYQFTASIVPTDFSSLSFSSFVHRGWLDKRGDGNILNGWQKRFFIVSLQDRAISYYKTPEAIFPQCFISLLDVLWCQPNSANSRRFDLVTATRVYHLQADSQASALKWIDAINISGKRQKEENSREFPNNNNNNKYLKNKPKTPKTPKILKNFWQERGNENNQFSSPSASTSSSSSASSLVLPRSSSSCVISPLRVAFFRLNFSVSSLNQPDFFHDLRHDFRDDGDIRAFLLDAIIRPESNEKAAAAIRQARDIEAREKELNNFNPQSLVNVNGSLNTRNNLNEETGGKSRGNRRREEEKEEEKIFDLAANQNNYSNNNSTRTKEWERSKRILRRSRSDLSLELFSLSDRVAPGATVNNFSVDEMCLGFFSPRIFLRSQLFYFFRYSLFHLSAHRAKSSAMMDGRKRIISWIHSNEAIQILTHSHQFAARLSLPLLFSLLQSRHHEDDQENENQKNNFNNERKNIQTPNQQETNKLNRTRRSPSLEDISTNNNTNTNTNTINTVSNIPSNNFSSTFRSRLLTLSPSSSTPNSSPPRLANQQNVRANPFNTPPRFHTVRINNSPLTNNSSPANLSNNSNSPSRHFLFNFHYSCSSCRSASNSFNQILRDNLDSGSICVTHLNILLSMLVTAINEFATISNISSDRHSVFNKFVVNGGLWPTILTILNKSSPFVKKHGLKDLTGVLVGSQVSSANCESLMEFVNWQSLCLPLLHCHQADAEDLSESELLEVRIFEKVENYAQNFIGILHFHAMMTRTPKEFARIIRKSFAMSRKLSNGKIRLSRSMLSVMIQRVTNKLRSKSLSLLNHWPHLLELISFVTHFTLGISHSLTDSNSMPGAAIDFAHLRASTGWRNSFDEDQELIEKCLILCKTAKILLEIDGNSINEGKKIIIQQQIESATTTKIPALLTATNQFHGNSQQSNNNNPNNPPNDSNSTSSLSLHHPLVRSKLTDVSGDLSVEFLSWSFSDRAAFLSCQNHAAVLKDAAALFAIIAARGEEISDEEISTIIQNFVTTEKREKSFNIKEIENKKFQNIKTRNRK